METDSWMGKDNDNELSELNDEQVEPKQLSKHLRASTSSPSGLGLRYD